MPIDSTDNMASSGCQHLSIDNHIEGQSGLPAAWRYASYKPCEFGRSPHLFRLSRRDYDLCKFQLSGRGLSVLIPDDCETRRQPIIFDS